MTDKRWTTCPTCKAIIRPHAIGMHNARHATEHLAATRVTSVLDKG
jgi:hypothetical protein